MYSPSHVIYNARMSDRKLCNFAGGGGRIATGSSLGAYVRKITAMEKVDKEDPRDAVLKYAKVKRSHIVHFYTHTHA